MHPTQSKIAGRLNDSRGAAAGTDRAAAAAAAAKAAKAIGAAVSTGGAAERTKYEQRYLRRSSALMPAFGILFDQFQSGTQSLRGRWCTRDIQGRRCWVWVMLGAATPGGVLAVWRCCAPLGARRVVAACERYRATTRCWRGAVLGVEQRTVVFGIDAETMHCAAAGRSRRPDRC